MVKIIAFLLTIFIVGTLSLPVPEPPSTNRKDVAQAMLPFTLQFFRNMSKFENEKGGIAENFAYSPLSVIRSLTLLKDMTPGDSRRQLQSSMGFEEMSKHISHSLNDLVEKVTLRIPGMTTPTVEMKNNVFLNNLWPISSQLVERFSEKQTSEVDAYDVEEMQDAVADWFINNEDVPTLPDDANIMMLNQVNFESFWECGFKEEDTEVLQFTGEENELSNVPMMSRKGYYKYAMTCQDSERNILDWGDLDCTNDAQPTVLEVPFGNNSLSMVFVVSTDDYSITNVVSDMETNLDKWRNNAEISSSLIRIPKFKMQYNAELSSILKENGVSKFQDYSEVTTTGEEPKSILSDFYHRSTISIHESGYVELEIEKKSLFEILFQGFDFEPEIVYREIKVDRPFVFMVEDRDTGVVVMMGKVSNPSSLQFS